MQHVRGRDDVTAAGGQAAYVYDANASPATWQLVLQDLQTCTGWWTSKTNYPDINQGNNNSHGFRWGVGDPGDSLFQTIVTPNSSTHQWANCRMDCGPGCGAVYTGYHNATSNHPGGVNVAMADGSVRFVKDSVAQMTWMQLGTKANGEVISSDAY
jgi:prepilin-type processing-associated H-X9-DG protein